MKHYPYPDKQLKTDKEVEEYIADIMSNVLFHLELSEYIFSVYLPSNPDYKPTSDDFGYEVNIKYPYKKFELYVSPHEVDLCKNHKPPHQVFENIERSLFHEGFHVILDELEEIGSKRFTVLDLLHNANERATDHLAHIFYPLVQSFRKKKK